MMNLLTQDLSFAVLRLPRALKTVMKLPLWKGKIYVGGGYLRAICSGEKVNDVDVFTTTKEQAYQLAYHLNAIRLGVANRFCRKSLTAEEKKQVENRGVYETDNALTLTRTSPTIQIIHKWNFNTSADVVSSFDFTVCCAAVWFDGKKWQSICDDRFYPDLASKRLVYRSPVRIEEAGGSLLRVLKYYQRGYRIPLDSLGAVIARLMTGVDFKKVAKNGEIAGDGWEAELSRIVTGLLRVVDPQIDPLHEAHLPADNGHLLDDKEKDADASQDN